MVNLKKLFQIKKIMAKNNGLYLLYHIPKPSWQPNYGKLVLVKVN